MMYGGGADCEIVSVEPGEGTGDSIYTTRSGRCFVRTGTCGSLPPGYRWSPRRVYKNINDVERVTITVTKDDMAEAEEEARLELHRKGFRWWMRYGAGLVYRPRFREVQMLTKPVNRARSHPVHVRNRPWDPRERA